MDIAVFSTKSYDRNAFEQYNAPFGHALTFLEPRLGPETLALGRGYTGVCIFVNDDCNAAVIDDLVAHGTRIIATRSAGYNQIDLAAAARQGIMLARVPAYSPHAVSEFTLALILTMGRKIHRAYNRTREFNFEIGGLEGFELRDKTVGVFGTGQIGRLVIKALHGFGCPILAYDRFPNAEVEQYARYVDQPTFARESDIITLHTPLTPQTQHLISDKILPLVKPGVFIINTSRGALLKTDKVIKCLKSGQIGMLAIDVFEEEADYFYQDLSEQVPTNDELVRLLSFPNVILTSHMAFLTDHALRNIAETTLGNFAEFEQTGQCTNQVVASVHDQPGARG
ncbi:MAG: 2-hydroxyacid dehydrogenase [Chromatiaceae bacterium]|nr:MAG: 2-hydroxyacid dehydrogenase [Chromatiaceae bacterium]